MLIYEKDNKLNINFENSVEETPDLQISKESGKTEVKIDGQQGGGSGGSFVIRANETAIENGGKKLELDKTVQEISDAILAGVYCCVIEQLGPTTRQQPVLAVVNDIENDEYLLIGGDNKPLKYTTNDKDGYPYLTITDLKPFDPGDVDTPGHMEEP